MNKSFFAFAALEGCAAFALAHAQDNVAVFTRDNAVPRADPARTVPVTQLSTLGLYGFPGGSYASGLSLLSGREYSLDYLALADVGDPVGGNSFGHAANVIANGNRAADGSVQFYRPPGKGGVSAGASYTRDDTNRDPSNRSWGMSLGYGLGPVTLRAAYQNRNVAKVRLYDLAGNNMEARNALIAANMRFSWGTAYVGYSANRGWGSSPLFNPDNPYGAGMATTPSTDSRDVLFGVAVPWGRSTTLLASFIHKNDRDLANRDANEFALGASYTVTRRTDFYAAYSYIQNLSVAGTPRTAYDARGHSTSALSFGMRHAF
jgi:predicted porin